MTVAWCLHVGPFDAVPQIRVPIKNQLVRLVHRLRSLLIVSTADKVQFWLVSDLDTLVVMGQTDLKVVHPIVELHPSHAIGSPVILKHILGVFLNYVDVIG